MQLSRAAFGQRRFNQAGINMVDLMMWLVIAALLLAAALQSIGYYQRAAWNYQLRADVNSVHTYVEGYRAANGVYPNWDATGAGSEGVVTLTGKNYISGWQADDGSGVWAFRVCSPALKAATGDAPGSGMKLTKNNPNNIILLECSQFG